MRRRAPSLSDKAPSPASELSDALIMPRSPLDAGHGEPACILRCDRWAEQMSCPMQCIANTCSTAHMRRMPVEIAQVIVSARNVCVGVGGFRRRGHRGCGSAKSQLLGTSGLVASLSSIPRSPEQHHHHCALRLAVPSPSPSPSFGPKLLRLPCEHALQT